MTGFYTFTVSKVQTDKSLVAGSGANESSHSQSQSSEKWKKKECKLNLKSQDKLFSTNSFLLSNKTFPDQRLKKKKSYALGQTHRAFALQNQSFYSPSRRV